MPNLVNPKIEVTVKGTADFILSDLDMEFDITKDLSDNPNTAELLIYNLGPNLKKQLGNAENQEAPIEIRITPSGSKDLVLAYGGEIQDVYTEFLNPGHVTTVLCESQKINHRAFPFDAEYKEGTPLNSIAEDLITAIGLPVGNKADIDTSGISLSQTFSGPAFPLLERLIYDQGLRAYITDGVLHISSIYVAGNFSVFKIVPGMILGGSEPRDTLRNDNFEIEMRTHVESQGTDPFSKVSKKKRKEKKQWASGTYVEYDGVDKAIIGVEIPLLAQPIINPDQILILDVEDYKKKYFRTQSVNHWGNNEFFDNWTTTINADLYEDNGGDLSAL